MKRNVIFSSTTKENTKNIDVCARVAEPKFTSVQMLGNFGSGY